MKKTPKISQLDRTVIDSLTEFAATQKKPRPAFRRIHNHIFYYNTFPSQLQEEKQNYPNFRVLNKNFLLTLFILGIAISKKVCYTIDVARRYKPMVK